MTTPQRGSSKAAARVDDARKKEVEAQMRAGHPTRTEDWRDPEPPADAPPYEEPEREEGER